MLRIPNSLKSRRYSVNRYYLDRFFGEMIAGFREGANIIDIGGHKKQKAGRFDIATYPLRVDYVNIDPQTEPDFLCDASSIPVDDQTYDGAILAEVLEHVKNPVAVLKESHRLLKANGTILITAPFMFPIHGHPQDYGRYTGQWYADTLAEIGFSGIEVRRHGSMLSVLANQCKLWSVCANSRLEAFILRWVSYYLIHRAMKQEASQEFQDHWLFGNSVLGYGVRATKA